MTSKVLHLLTFLVVAIVVCAALICKTSKGECDDPSYTKCGKNQKKEDATCTGKTTTGQGACIVKKAGKKYTFGCKKPGDICAGNNYCCQTNTCNKNWKKTPTKVGKPGVKPKPKDGGAKPNGNGGGGKPSGKGEGGKPSGKGEGGKPSGKGEGGKPNGNGTGVTTKPKKSASTTTRSTGVAVLLVAAMAYLR